MWQTCPPVREDAPRQTPKIFFYRAKIWPWIPYRGSKPGRTDWLSVTTLTDSQPLHPKDGRTMDLWNVGILPQHYTASQPIRPRLEISLPWKPQNLHYIKWHVLHEISNFNALKLFSTLDFKTYSSLKQTIQPVIRKDLIKLLQISRK
jgi:hypothetical protein